MRLGGNWLSLIAVNLGAVIFWSSIFQPEMMMTLQGITYAFWALAMLPIVWELFQIIYQVFEPMPVKMSAST